MIVDASVAIKWIILEDGSAEANALFGRFQLNGPDIVVSEIANVLWKKCAKGELMHVPSGLAEVPALFDRLYPTAPLIDRAVGLAVELAHPAYDCFYLALAERENEPLLTADLRLIRRLAGTPYANRVLTLADVL